VELYCAKSFWWFIYYLLYNLAGSSILPKASDRLPLYSTPDDYYLVGTSIVEVSDDFVSTCGLIIMTILVSVYIHICTSFLCYLFNIFRLPEASNLLVRMFLYAVIFKIYLIYYNILSSVVFTGISIFRKLLMFYLHIIYSASFLVYFLPWFSQVFSSAGSFWCFIYTLYLARLSWLFEGIYIYR